MATATTIIAMIITRVRVRVDRDGRSGDDTGGSMAAEVTSETIHLGTGYTVALIPSVASS